MNRTVIVGIAVAAFAFGSSAFAQSASAPPPAPSGGPPPSQVETLELVSHADPAPPGARVVRRPIVTLSIVGAAIFLGSYVPWAVDGGIHASSPVNNMDRASVWRAIPIAGDFIALVDYNNRQSHDCAAAMGMMTFPQAAAGVNGSCTDLNSGMVDANNRPLAPNYVARLASGGDWLFATVLASLQVYGIAVVLWGLVADRTVVQRVEARNQAPASRRMRWTLAPGAPNAPLGLSFQAITF